MALKRIVLRDFVIVSEMELDLERGFTVLTGETGAGKSILIDALQLVTGVRAEVGVIREGAQRADVSAEFDAPPNLQTSLAEMGFDASDSLLLRRTVDLQGKSRAWVNGSPATAQQLRALGEQLLDIHGQHAWQSLTRPDAVRGLLDAYAQVSTQALAGLWQQWRQAQTALSDALAAQDSLQRERERLAWQIGELDKLAAQPDEWAELNASHRRLSNAQALMDAAQAALQVLQDDETNALQLLHNAHQQLQAQAHLEADFAAPIELLASSLAQVQDTAHTLRAYLRRTDLDPQGLAELDARLGQWVALARRYKRAAEDLPELLTSWKAELRSLDAAADLDGLRASEQQTHAAYLKEAQALSKKRAHAAPLLARAITQAMQGLGMQGGVFQVDLEPASAPMQSGLEDVAFLVAGHTGSTPRPVGKVASGGELSRMALAIAVTTSQLGTAQTLIFDEVDAGVGGAVAQTVGRLMRQLGVDRQVLAVTHLPQVAACADHHLCVAKQLHGRLTLSTVSPLHGEERVTEIARMLGGEKLSTTTLAHAKEMLQTGV
ncbi:MAG: DNA repair protein RecN [Burkholderiales bacterium]|nr:DNA repair protein RecN [Burkholderiales bacterium]